VNDEHRFLLPWHPKPGSYWARPYPRNAWQPLAEEQAQTKPEAPSPKAWPMHYFPGLAL
jgi:hypothetical protein